VLRYENDPMECIESWRWRWRSCMYKAVFWMMFFTIVILMVKLFKRNKALRTANRDNRALVATMAGAFQGMAEASANVDGAAVAMSSAEGAMVPPAYASAQQQGPNKPRYSSLA